MNKNALGESPRSTLQGVVQTIFRTVFRKRCVIPVRVDATAFCRTGCDLALQAKTTLDWVFGFFKADTGAVTLEYAITFPLFFSVFLGIFQFGVSFATQSLIDNATRDAARLIRIGTITGSSYSNALVTAVCNDLTLSNFTVVPSCSTSIQIYVAAENAGTPSGAGFKSLVVATNNKGALSMTTKALLAPKYDVLLQVAFQMPWYASLYSGAALLTSTAAFQSEPY